MTMQRRDALKTFCALAGAAGLPRLLSGCGAGPAGPGNIDTMVFLMMENRSYDHVLGARSMLEGAPGDGLTAAMSNPDRAGAAIAPWAATASSMCVIDPPHGWEAARAQWANGQNDGFVVAHQIAHGSTTAIEPMQYQVRAQQPVTWALADAYTSCDRWFSAILGPTWPNRMYWHSASSGGLTENVFPDDGFDWPTIYHRLNDAGVDWTYYFSDLPALAALSEGVADGHVKRVMYDFLDDAAAGRLAPVVYLDPAFDLNDDHPPHHPILGQQFLAMVYQALATSPQWERCLLVVTYDEHGGFFDHVAPGTTVDERSADGFGQRGFRVPGLVIGPYARAGHLSSVVRDHTSPLRHLENVFGLETLNSRTMAATDLTDCIDLERLAAGAPAAPIRLPAVEVDESMIGGACMGGAFHHDVLAWGDAARLPPDLDRRRFGREYAHDIGEYLDRHGLGRVRRGR